MGCILLLILPLFFVPSMSCLQYSCVNDMSCVDVNLIRGLCPELVFFFFSGFDTGCLVLIEVPKM
jgi:hypothetical protein